MRRILKGILLTFLALLVISGGFLVYVRFGLEGQSAARLVVPRLETALEKKIAYSSVSLSWLSVATGRITFTDVMVTETVDRIVWLHVPRAVFDVNLASAWRGRLVVNRAEIFGPVVTLKGVGREQREGQPERARRTGFPLTGIVVENLRIIQGQVVVADARGKSPAGEVLVSEINGEADSVSLQGARGLKVEGAVTTADKKGVFSVSAGVDSLGLKRGHWQGRLQVRLLGCPVSALREIALHFGQELPISAGTVDFNARISSNGSRLEAKGEGTLSQAVLMYSSLFSQEVMLERAVAKFAVARSRDSLEIDLSESTLPGLTVSAEARIGNISRGNATLTVAIRNADLDLEKILPILPLNLLKMEDRTRLLEAGLKGRILVRGGAWTGETSDLSKGFNLRGTLGMHAVLDKVSGFVPGLGLPIEHASGEVLLKADEIFFKGVSLILGTSPIVLNGWITDLRKSPNTDLFISMDAQAQDLTPILEYKAIATSLQPWMGRIIEPAGRVSVTLDLKGSLKRPTMKGKIDLKDFQCSIDGFALPLKKVSGSMRFRTTGITFSQIEGVVGVSAVSLHGNLVPDDVDIVCDAKVNSGDLKKLNVLPSGFTISGSIPLSVNLKGKASSLNFSAVADLKTSSLGYSSLIKKKSGVPCRMEASGKADQERITVEEAYLLLGECRIAARGSASSNGEAGLSIDLPPKGIPTEALIPLFDPSLEVQPGGRIEGSVIVKSDKSADTSVEANLQLSHVSLRFPGFHKRTEGINATIRHKGRTFSVVLDRARNGSSIYSGAMTSAGWDRPKVEIALKFDFLDTQDFTAPPGYASDVTWGEWIRSNEAIRFLARSRGTGLVTVAKGKAPVRSFSNFRANMEGKDGLLKSTGWHLKIADGMVRGNALFDIRPSTQIPLTLDFQADHLRMEQIMMSDPEWLRVEGDMGIEGQLEWKLTANRANDGIYKTGKIGVRVTNGAINRFDILSKVFALVNLGSIIRGRLPDLIGQGLPFHRLTWNMEVFDSKWKFNDMNLFSDAARVSASGMYFSDQDRIDFRLDVSPLVGFDTIFSGLFGNLITKDGKIFTTTFRVRGLYKTPDVRLEPFQNLRSGN